jgi:hypothetical protein
VTRGALGAYRIVRDVKTMSNDRGIFWLNVAPMTLAPGEEYVLEWVIFPHEGVEDFFNRLRTVNPRHIDVETEGYNLFSGEAVRISFKPVFAFDPAAVTVTRDGRPVDYQNIKSLADFVLIQIGWLRGELHFGTSRALAAGRGHLDFRRRFLAELTGGDPEVDALCRL